MSQSTFDVNHRLVELTMVLKLQKLQKEDLPTLTYVNLEDYLNHLWRNKSPRTLNQAVDVVWNVAAMMLYASYQHKLLLMVRRKTLKILRMSLEGINLWQKILQRKVS